jgi:hypothetical protein
MPGGLMQLTFVGGQNIFLTGNPSISFFKSVYRTHTNFSMESKRLDLSRTELYFTENTQYVCKILRYADLVNQMYLCLTLPDIYDDTYEFKWVENIGEVILENYQIYIGGSLIDTQYGEWLNIWNELTLKTKRVLYDKMIGNTLDMYDPAQFNDGSYPFHSVSSGIPSIKGRQIIIPLNFWFNNNSGLALPLISIQYQEVEIRFELKKAVDLYLIKNGNNYIKPSVSYSNQLLSKFIVNSTSDTYINIYPYIEANYIYLDNDERKLFAHNSQEYLIEQLTRIDEFALNNQHNIVTFGLNNPTKELFWVFKRTDNGNLNNWLNFIDNDINSDNILKTGRIIFNGVDRTEDKNSEYFNMIQPYQYHNNRGDGIYVYSFSLNPNIFQPTGFCNMSVVNKIQLYLEINTPNTNNYEYDLSLYTTSYNFLRVISGNANVAFQL